LFISNVTWNFDTASFSETFETNVYPIFWTVQKAVDYLQAGATITLTSSVQGYNPSPILHGATQFTRMPFAPSSSDRLFVNEIIAAFEAA
jgi:NAD(P)-dependent dehydrogenase (short-subunit alcohol dehydrogenase family)